MVGVGRSAGRCGPRYGPSQWVQDRGRRKTTPEGDMTGDKLPLLWTQGSSFLGKRRLSRGVGVYESPRGLTVFLCA